MYCTYGSLVVKGTFSYRTLSDLSHYSIPPAVDPHLTPWALEIHAQISSKVKYCAVT